MGAKPDKPKRNGFGIVYLLKLITLIFVAIITILFSTDMFNVFISSMLFLLTVLWDMIFASITVYRSFLHKIMKWFVYAMLAIIAVAFLASIGLAFYVARNPEFDCISKCMVMIVLGCCACMSVGAEFILTFDKGKQNDKEVGK